MTIFKRIEQLLYDLRNLLWRYPDLLFFGEESLAAVTNKFYRRSRPFSHFVFLTVVIITLVATVATNVQAFLRINATTYLEGAIVGVDENGDLQQLHRINPLINTNVQLEKDLNELIYESLVTVRQNGEVLPVLADYVTLQEGELYQFKLKEDLFWQDGERVTTDDVRATFDLVRELDNSPRTSTIHSRAVNKVELNVIDELSFEVKLNSVIPSFFEAISFKILPEHLFGGLNAGNITTSDPLINRQPIGTGPFTLVNSTDNQIDLVKNKYYREQIQLEQLKFKLFPDEESAVNAIKSGQIHAIAGISFDNLREVQDLLQVEVLNSNVIYNQYWGMYFNLGDNGPAFLKNKQVRQAISSAVNRELIIEALLGYASEAAAPIPPTSFAYSKPKAYRYNKEKAVELFKEAGWSLPKGKDYREKDGKVLEFDLMLIDNPDRLKIAEVISKDLAEVGVKVNIVTKNLEELTTQHLIPRQYEVLLYGVHTFIDPDRYELFHSSQIEHPGLNISSYKSKEEVLAVVDNETVMIPEVDDALDDARKIVDNSRRKVKYDIFLDIVADEVPVVFLFYPREAYVINKRVSGVKIDNINSIEERFNSISEWAIGV